jgi:type IV pilus assembly protein PilM
MAFSLRKNNPSGTVGLDIDGRFLAAVRAGDGRVERVATADLPEGVVRDGEVVDRPALASALKDFTARERLPRRVRLGISNRQIVVRVIELPQIEDRDELEAALRFQAADAIAMPLEDAVLDHQVVGNVEVEGSRRMQVIVTAARRSMVEQFYGAAKDAGLRPDGIDLDAFALVRMLADDTYSDQSARVFCHLAEVTTLAVAVGRSCFFSRALSTRATESDVDRRDLAWVGELADEIRLSIDYYRAQAGARRADELVLSGPGATEGELVTRLGAELAMNVSIASPLGMLDVPPALVNGDAQRYTVAAGLAIGADQ